MHIYVIRHGQTDWNLKWILQGQNDIPLNDTGRAQAAESRRLVEGVHLDRVIASPLGRAVETARIVTEGRDLPMETDPRLMERGFGSYVGGPWDAAPLQQLWTLSEDTGLNGTEPLPSMLERVYGFLQETLAAHPGEDILLVTHGGTARCIESFFHGPYSQDILLHYLPKNAQLACYEWPDAPTDSACR